jgi:hypothetical protein
MSPEGVKSFLSQVELQHYRFKTSSDLGGSALIEITHKGNLAKTVKFLPTAQPSEILREIFRLISDYEDAILRETFRYRGRPIYTTLIDADRLWDACEPENMSGAS